MHSLSTHKTELLFLSRLVSVNDHVSLQSESRYFLRKSALLLSFTADIPVYNVGIASQFTGRSSLKMSTLLLDLPAVLLSKVGIASQFYRQIFP